MIASEDHATFIQHLTRVREQTSCSPASERCTLHLVNANLQNVEVRLESTLVPSTEYPVIRINVYHITHGGDDSEQCHSDLALINLQLQKEISERKLAEEKMHQHQDELAHVARFNTVGEMASAGARNQSTVGGHRQLHTKLPAAVARR